jgi:hypothetical protein
MFPFASLFLSWAIESILDLPLASSFSSYSCRDEGDLDDCENGEELPENGDEGGG